MTDKIEINQKRTMVIDDIIRLMRLDEIEAATKAISQKEKASNNSAQKNPEEITHRVLQLQIRSSEFTNSTSSRMIFMGRYNSFLARAYHNLTQKNMPEVRFYKVSMSRQEAPLFYGTSGGSSFYLASALSRNDNITNPLDAPARTFENRLVY